MRQSQLFSKIKKESPQEAEAVSHQLLVKADYISQLASGIYFDQKSFPPTTASILLGSTNIACPSESGTPRVNDSEINGPICFG